MRRLIVCFLTSLFASSLAACEDDSLKKVDRPDAGMRATRCLEDKDCPDRHRCNATTGICYPLDVCGPNDPCPKEGQKCEEGPDGYRICVFERCMEDSECSDLQCPMGQVPTCSAGGCICGEPCSGGCPAGRGCCIPEDRCYELPAQCMGLTCPVGQFVSVTSTGAWDTGQCEVVGESCQCERLPPLAEGDLGLHSAVARNGQNIVLSAYSLTYGDLVYGSVQSDGSINWIFVDGVPTSTQTITGDVDGPRGGQSGPGEDVGIYTDIIIGEGDRPHISYQDRDRGALKYAVFTQNGWQTHTIDGAMGPGDVGLYSSLGLSNQGRPVIAYLAAREGSPRRSVLRLAVANTVTPTEPGHWQLRDLVSFNLAGQDCEHRCNVGEVCLSVGQRCVTPAADSACSPRCGSGEACVAGICQATTSLPPFRSLPLAKGLWPSLAFLPNGNALVAYYDSVDNNLNLVRIAGPDLTSGAITQRTLAGQGSPIERSDDTGRFPSLFVTPGGEIHLAYMNVSQQSVRYMNLAANLNVDINETIQSGLGSMTNRQGELLGADVSLVVDAQGSVRVAYQNATAGDLIYARRVGGSWSSPQVVAGQEMPYRGSFGFYTDQALSADRSRATLSTYRYFLAAPMGGNNGVELFDLP